MLKASPALRCKRRVTFGTSMLGGLLVMAGGGFLPLSSAPHTPTLTVTAAPLSSTLAPLGEPAEPQTPIPISLPPIPTTVPAPTKVTSSQPAVAPAPTAATLSQPEAALAQVPASVAPALPRELTYRTEHRVALVNEGPGVVSRALLRVALFQTREPYQTLVSTDIGAENYVTMTDDLGNTFAQFELFNIAPGKERAVRIGYRVQSRQVETPRRASGGTAPSGFLGPEPWIESDAGEIQALAKELTQGKSTPRQKARAIYDWVGDNLFYDGYYEGNRGALFALRNRKGDCTEYAYLMTALSRAAGIPARFVEGLMSGSKTATLGELKHDWLEVYLPESGWVPMDPTMGRLPENRERYFAQTTPEHLVLTIGNPALISRLYPPFHYFEYRYWWGGQPAKMSHTENWQIGKAN